MHHSSANERVLFKTPIEALAAGLRDGGAAFVANYPGFHSNVLTDLLGCRHTSVNERTAFSMAWGAAAAGSRSVVAFKNVGLSDAADPFLNAQLLGINAGLAVVVFDDIDDEHSQIRQDSRHYFAFHGGLWIEPRTPAEAYDAGRDAFDASERCQCPVVIRLTNLHTRFGRKNGYYIPRPPAGAGAARRPFQRDADRFVVHPSLIPSQQQRKRSRDEAVRRQVEAMHPGDIVQSSDHLAIILGGAPERSVPQEADLLFCRTLPLPEGLLVRLLPRYGQVTVFEHGDPIGATMIAGLRATGAGVARRPLATGHPNRRYHCRGDYEPLFAPIRSRASRIVSGDLGEFTMDARRSIDLCLCYGASVAVGAGAACAAPSDQRVFVISGDGAYLHSGKLALEEAAARGLPMTVIVIDNGGCRGTGGQAIPGQLEPAPQGVFCRRLGGGPGEAARFASVLEEAEGHPGPSLVIVEKRAEVLP